jgi:hypothetical protein
MKEESMRAVVLGLVLGMVLLGSTAVLADPAESIRCGENVIEVGDSVVTVMEKCGTPTHKDGTVWFYDLGPGESIKVFHMENEQVDSMEEMDRR